MYSNRPPPPYPERLTVALLRKRVQLKNIIGNMILGNENRFVTMSNNFSMEKNNSFQIINTPDFFDEESMHPDQQIIDFMALSHPGPDLFILAIDSENTQVETVVVQISKLQDTFGDKITAHLVVTLPDIESFHSLSRLKEMFDSRLAIANENLASECKKWCHGRHSFLFDYKNYSQDIVLRRRTALAKRRANGHPLDHHEGAGAELISPSISQHASAEPAETELERDHGSSAYEVSGNIYNIILLGLTGTGKSASANTILAAEHSEVNSRPFFKSEASSMPVTTQCEVRTMEKLFGMQVRVVDTPDFFHDHLKNSESQVEECKKYCQPGRCVVLLVLQLGRFTNVEKGILEKLETKLGWRIRDSTIVLLTHGEDLRGTLEQFINTNASLKDIVALCGNRYHLFSNTSRDTKQVMELLKKIPNCKNIFPNFTKKRNGPQCCVC